MSCKKLKAFSFCLSSLSIILGLKLPGGIHANLFKHSPLSDEIDLPNDTLNHVALGNFK